MHSVMTGESGMRRTGDAVSIVIEERQRPSERSLLHLTGPQVPSGPVVALGAQARARCGGPLDGVRVVVARAPTPGKAHTLGTLVHSSCGAAPKGRSGAHAAGIVEGMDRMTSCGSYVEGVNALR